MVFVSVNGLSTKFLTFSPTEVYWEWIYLYR